MKNNTLKTILRLLLGCFLMLAGISHLTWLRAEFWAQVPSWVPLSADLTIILSGLVEILLGASLLLFGKYRVNVGWIVALFFVLIFPGNISQYVHKISAFGLDTDRARAIRLLFQPVLVIWALWCTGAWSNWRKRYANNTKH